MITTLSWAFPLPRTHTGVPLGNGRTGLLVWGEGNRLRITIGRADLWDHRGGLPWTAEQSFPAIRALLEAGDERAIRDLFRPAKEAPAGSPSKPTILPFGRLELELSRGCRLTDASLALADGVLTVRYLRERLPRALTVMLHPSRDLGVVQGTDDVVAVTPVTSWDLMGEKLAAAGHRPPVHLGDESAPGVGQASHADAPPRVGMRGWFWSLPADAGAWAFWRETRLADAGALIIAAGRAGSADEAVAAAGHALDAVDVTSAEAETIGWWRRYRRRGPQVDLPNPALQEIHDYGLYLFGAMSNPEGVAAGLQGPWIEEYDYPPWSADYHFNINVQMCYSPAYRAGYLEHLGPLFAMLASWGDRLRQTARLFAGVEDGVMLPHSVDDRGTCMGTFWTGAIDHACTAWVAQMMYDYADYSGNLDFLRDQAMPFMRGAFAVYRAMMEDDGKALRLPVTVSPEYRGASMDAWGANASFQLAAVHRLCENLTVAAATLGEEPDPAWDDVRARLPRVTTIGAPGSERIALWEGVDLEESHRHHSHLAAIAPFDTIDPCAPAERELVARSLRHWIATGMGFWSGWCMSWASQLHARVGNGDGAELLLELWKRVFTNEGRASMHDAVSNGVTLMGAPALLGAAAGRGSESARGSTTGGILAQAERMQLDGVMGCVAAVQEMLLHTARGTLRVFPAVPRSWPYASFTGMRAPGGFEVSAWMKRREGWGIDVLATRAGTLRVEPPQGAFTWSVQVAGDPASVGTAPRDGRGEGVLAVRLEAGQQLTVTAYDPTGERSAVLGR